MTLKARTPPVIAVRNRAVDFEIRASSFLRHWAFRPSSFAPAWDIDNRLSAKTQDSQALGTADYQYDVLGRRVAKDSGGGSAGKTVILWWNMREVADYETTGTNPDAIHHYINLPRHNDRLARTVQVGSSEQVQYYHKNYLDHIYAITDEDGDALEYIRYSAFGIATFYDFSGLKVANSPTGNQFTWNAKRLDPHLGWYVYHYRHYSPELGRWTSRDPIEEDGGVNLYGFVGNCPVFLFDILGLSDFSWWDLAPLVGSSRSAVEAFNDGSYGWMVVHGALAVSDVFIVTAVASACRKGAWKYGGVAWSTVKSWYKSNHKLAPWTPVHHWMIHQNGWLAGKLRPLFGDQAVNRLINQPWNLMPMVPPAAFMQRTGGNYRVAAQAFHNAVHGHTANAFRLPGQLWHGVPHWAKNTVGNAAARLATLFEGAEPDPRVVYPQAVVEELVIWHNRETGEYGSYTRRIFVEDVNKYYLGE